MGQPLNLFTENDILGSHIFTSERVNKLTVSDLSEISRKYLLIGECFLFVHLKTLSYIKIITAHKRSLRRLCFYTCTSVHRGVVSQHALQVSGGAYTRGEIERSGWGGGVSRPTPGGGGWGVWPGGISRPTPWGGLQVHSWGGGGFQAHTWGGVSQYALRQTPPADGYYCEQYASYWNAFLFWGKIRL